MCPGWIFISDNTSHSNNHVNHYIQQIHEHYDVFYVQNNSKCACGREKGRERYVAQVKDDQCKHERDYVVFHLPKSQVKLLIDFNNRRIQIVGDLRMYI